MLPSQGEASRQQPPMSSGYVRHNAKFKPRSVEIHSRGFACLSRLCRLGRLAREGSGRTRAVDQDLEKESASRSGTRKSQSR